ncbi:interleukin enhancer-binding factor 3-B-like [Lissotriton helveticus]
MHPQFLFLKDSRHVMARHSAFYPTQEEMEAVRTIIAHTEQALKSLSDSMEEQEKSQRASLEQRTGQEDNPEEAMEGFSTAAEELGNEFRALQGVVGVGSIGKGLLLKGDVDLEMVLLCRDAPTVTLLKRVAEHLSLELSAITERYNVSESIPEGAVVVQRGLDPLLKLTVRLASVSAPDGKAQMTNSETVASNNLDVLDRQTCLAALRSIRRTQWFHAQALGLKSCVIVIRVLRSLCCPLPSWAPLSSWPLEILCQRVIATVSRPMGAAEAFRRVLECLASGFLLPGGPGLHDPCEDEPTDAVSHLEMGQREAITRSAQHALRLVAFGLIHKVLGTAGFSFKRRMKSKRKHANISYRMQITPSSANNFGSMNRSIKMAKHDTLTSKCKRGPYRSDPFLGMTALMRLSLLRPDLHYIEVSQTGTLQAPLFTMATNVDGNTFKASGHSKYAAKNHLAIKVLQAEGLVSGQKESWMCSSANQAASTPPDNTASPKQDEPVLTKSGKNPVRELIKMMRDPKYRAFSVGGGGHRQIYLAEVEVHGQTYQGMAFTRKKAKARAALAALDGCQPSNPQEPLREHPGSALQDLTHLVSKVGFGGGAHQTRRGPG